MKDLTLIIPAKNESESLPSVLKELEKYNFKIRIVLSEDDVKTINSIKDLDVEIIYQQQKVYGDALITGIESLNDGFFCIFMDSFSYMIFICNLDFYPDWHILQGHPTQASCI